MKNKSRTYQAFVHTQTDSGSDLNVHSSGMQMRVQGICNIVTYNTHSLRNLPVTLENVLSGEAYNKISKLGPVYNRRLQALNLIMTSFTVLNQTHKYFLIPSNFHTGFSTGEVAGRYLMLL
jgi:hypothetical protein